MRLTTSQALVRYLLNQYIVEDGVERRFFAGVWSIFGHGNVSALGEALYGCRTELPTYRAHNEQGMALAAIAYAKASLCRSAMVCTTSIGPGATNMVTAAALAHVNRLPVLLLPGDVFASRRPDPVLQQVEHFMDATVSANDCFRPVSRYFDRIQRPEQIVTALPRAMHTLLDAAACGPVTLALCQDVQAEACEYDEAFFARRVWQRQSPRHSGAALVDLAERVRAARRPMIICGGGIKYARANDALDAFVRATGIPFAETQAGKGALPFDHPLNLGAIGVTGSAAANATAAEADLVIGMGTRLQDFTTASRTLFAHPGRTLAQVNANSHDAHKHGAIPFIGNARSILQDLSTALSDYAVPSFWRQVNKSRASEWRAVVDVALSRAPGAELTYADVLGAIDRSFGDDAIIVSAAGSLPGELHKLWRTRAPGGYHVEYGYSCMGYELAGGLGVKMAHPDSEVVVVVGDGSYLMMNSELATAVMLGCKLTVVIFDNRGFACIDNLQRSTGSEGFNNLFEDSIQKVEPSIDLAAHARSMGANATSAASMDELESALRSAAQLNETSAIVVPVGRGGSDQLGGAWWDVAVPEVSDSENVRRARAEYDRQRQEQRLDG